LSYHSGVHPCFQRRETWWHKEAFEESFRFEENQAQNLVCTYHSLKSSYHVAIVWSTAPDGASNPRTIHSIADDTDFFLVFFIPAACEEVGWMGYAVDPMQDRWSALKTSLILGSVWAIWHVIPWLEANTPVWVAGQCFSTIGLRVLIVWLYNNTGKSVFAAIVFHDMINVSEFLFPNYGSHYDPFISGAIIAVIVIIVTFLWGPKTLAQYRYGRPQASHGDGSLM
jgi:hypothetical protein